MNIQQDNSKQNARTRHIDIRLTQKEYEAIVEKAAECKPDEIKKRYFRDEDYMRAWIEAVNRLIVRWGQIRDSINQI